MVSIERTRDVWKRAADFPSNKEYVYPEHAQVQEFVTNSQKKVFEYGCGGGADTLSYLRRMCKVWYADVVKENVERTTHRVLESGKKGHAWGLVLDDSAPIPLGAGYFEIVNCHGVLHHIADEKMVEFVLREFHRLLVSGGALYLMLYTEHMWSDFSVQMASLLSQHRVADKFEAFGWCSDGEEVPYARCYSEIEGRVLLKSAGFEVATVSLYNHNHFRTFKAIKP